MAALAHYRAWIFDLDGTLTLPIHDFDGIRAALGIPRGRMILEYIAEQHPKQQQRLIAQLDEIEVELARRARPAVGCSNLLDALAQRDITVGIVTRNSSSNARLSLNAIGLGHHFPAHNVIGRDEAAPKPQPEGLLKLLDRWGHSSNEGLMIGDSRIDIDAGHRAAMTTVLVGRGAAGEFEPHFVVDSLADLAQLL